MPQCKRTIKISKKREKYESFLKNVEILSTIDRYELSQVADALCPVSFKQGDYIIKQVNGLVNCRMIQEMPFTFFLKEKPMPQRF
jgi:hypothetical protein